MLVAALAAAISTTTAEAAQGSLRVLSFTGEIVILSGGQVITLKPGMPGFTVTPGSELTVVSGDALLMTGDIKVRLDRMDSLFLTNADGLPAIAVKTGSIEVESDGSTRIYDSGDLAILGAPRPTKPLTPRPVAPTPETVRAPKKPWDLLSALAAFRRPKFNVNIELHPYFGIDQAYDTNIYRVPQDNENGMVVGGGVVGSWITTANLGLNIKSLFTRNSILESSYDFSALNYSHQPAANNAFNQAIQTKYSYKGRRGTTFSGSNIYANNESPAFSEIVTRERQWSNTTAISLDVKRSRRFFFGLDGSHSIQKFLAPTLGGLLNHYSQSLGGRIGVMVRPKTKAFLSYARNIIHYSAGRQANSKGHSLTLNVDGTLAPRLKGSAGAGMSYRKYDESLTGIKGSNQDLSFTADLRYQLSRRTSLALSLFRSLSEATFGSSRFYIGTGGRLSATHRFPKVTLSADFGMEIAKYPETDTLGGATASRRDDTYTGGAKITYKLRDWLSTAASYTRTQRHSIFTGDFNFKTNVTAIEFKISL